MSEKSNECYQKKIQMGGSRMPFQANVTPPVQQESHGVVVEEIDDTEKTVTIYQPKQANQPGNQLAILSPKMQYLNMMDINFKGLKGWTPLHWAVFQNHDKIVELLLKAGSDVNVLNNEGKTPLDIAKELNRESTIKILMNPPVPDWTEFLSWPLEPDDDDLSSEDESEDENEKKKKTKKNDNKEEEKKNEKKSDKQDNKKDDPKSKTKGSDKNNKDKNDTDKSDKNKDGDTDSEDEEEKKKRKKKKKKNYQLLDEYVHHLGQFVYQGMEGLQKGMVDMKEHLEYVAVTHTDRVIEAVSVVVQ